MVLLGGPGSGGVCRVPGSYASMYQDGSRTVHGRASQHRSSYACLRGTYFFSFAILCLPLAYYNCTSSSFFPNSSAGFSNKYWGLHAPAAPHCDFVANVMWRFEPPTGGYGSTILRRVHTNQHTM